MHGWVGGGLIKGKVWGRAAATEATYGAPHRELEMYTPFPSNHSARRHTSKHIEIIAPLHRGLRRIKYPFESARQSMSSDFSKKSEFWTGGPGIERWGEKR